jgi:hypothetical protein
MDIRGVNLSYCITTLIRQFIAYCVSGNIFSSSTQHLCLMSTFLFDVHLGLAVSTQTYITNPYPRKNDNYTSFIASTTP